MRGAAALLGVSLCVGFWTLPLGAWMGAAFPVHMLRHMGLVAVAAPLLAIGLPWLRGAFAVPALIGAVVEFVVVWAWHLPGLHAAAQTTGLGFFIEQAMFLLAGLMIWGGALAAHPLIGAGAMLLTTMHMTLLGALLTLAPRDLYAAICGRAPNLDGQQVGGLLMLGIGTPVYLFAGLILMARALDVREVEA